MLAAAGFMINVRKCHFLVVRAVILGWEICDGTAALADKALKRWIGQRLPRNLREL